MLSEGNAIPRLGVKAESPLEIVTAVWSPFCLNSNFPGRVWRDSPLLTTIVLQKAITICRGLSHPTRSPSRTVCRGQKRPKGRKGTLRPDFQASTRPIYFFKANVTTRGKKTVVRKSRYNYSLRQFKDNEAWIQLGQESPLMSKKGLRYDKISSQNMQCKHEKIRQKSKVKNLPKLFGARNPRNCYCSLEQQEVLKSVVYNYTYLF